MRLEDMETRFEEIYRIYEEAFPETERRTKEGQRLVLHADSYRLYVKEEEGQILAFLGAYRLPGCWFLEHLATTEKCRGKGYGKELVEECLRDAEALDKENPVFLEIEPVTEEAPMTGRRAGFYRRIRFCVNQFPYEQMPLKAGDEPIPLWVMSYGKQFSEQEFLPYKREIYELVYGVSM